jgi:hypothetical protein
MRILSRLWVTDFNTRFMTTLDYGTIADLHTLQITTAYATTFQSAVSLPVIPW